jgi:N-acyl-D-aspartate/D-glutamate deacylase
MFDLKFTGGTVVDGTRANRYRADVGIKDGHDLPAGGRRLIQGAKGYDATVMTRRHGVDSGARPGQLIRGVR